MAAYLGKEAQLEIDTSIKGKMLTHACNLRGKRGFNSGFAGITKGMANSFEFSYAEHALCLLLTGRHPEKK
ncbi:MAG: hypothetical protein K8F91_09730 [Candidatus Obscuribacterales bacterium]|nr:hypothetical protein [Candidatus Obscuribacterales bacterium]